jgi:hypothetical protein
MKHAATYDIGTLLRSISMDNAPSVSMDAANVTCTVNAYPDLIGSGNDITRGIVVGGSPTGQSTVMLGRYRERD